MGADDVPKTGIGDETQPRSRAASKISRPAGDDAADGGVGLAPDQRHLVGPRPPQRRDHLAHGDGKARHGQAAPRAQGAVSMVAAHGSESRWPGRAGDPVTHIVIDRQHGLKPGQRLADDARKNPEAALFGLPGRTTMVGSRMPTPSNMPRRNSRSATARRSSSARRSWSSAR